MDASQSNGPNPFEVVWEMRCRSAAESRRLKSSIANARWRALAMTVIAAIFAVLSDQIFALVPEEQAGSWARVSQFFAWVAAAAAALVVYLNRELLDPARQREWVSARSLAEAYKALAYKYAVRIPPFDAADPMKVLRERAEKLSNRVIPKPVEGDAEYAEYKRRLDQAPADPLDVESYFYERVDNQIGWYEREAGKAVGSARRWRGATFWLGIAGVLVGTVGATWEAMASAWIGVITSMGAAISSYIAAERFDFLAVSYQAAADRLTWRRNTWTHLAPAERTAARRNRIIAACEEAMSSENSAWVAEWMRDEAGDRDNGSDGGGGSGERADGTTYPAPGAPTRSEAQEPAAGEAPCVPDGAGPKD